MRIAVIAADGRSGRAVVRELLEHGHEVVAGARRPDRVPAQERLIIKECDATNLGAVIALAQGCDAISSFIGHVRGSRPDVQTVAAMHMVQAARSLSIQRIVSLTGTGVRFPDDTPSLLDRILNYAVKLVDPQRIQDGIDHTEVLKASGLHWTLIRVLKLTNGPAKPFRLTPHGPGKVFVSRAEVAQAVRQVLEADYDMVAPVISQPQKA